MLRVRHQRKNEYLIGIMYFNCSKIIVAQWDCFSYTKCTMEQDIDMTKINRLFLYLRSNNTRKSHLLAVGSHLVNPICLLLADRKVYISLLSIVISRWKPSKVGFPFYGFHSWNFRLPIHLRDRLFSLRIFELINQDFYSCIFLDTSDIFDIEK